MMLNLSWPLLPFINMNHKFMFRQGIINKLSPREDKLKKKKKKAEALLLFSYEELLALTTEQR